MTSYIPPAIDWVREQVELYESSGGTKGTTLRDTGLPCIIVTKDDRDVLVCDRKTDNLLPP